MDLNAFMPLTSDTVAMSISTSSESDPVSKSSDPLAGGSHLRICNLGPDKVFINLGGSGVVAAIPVEDTPATGIPIPSGMVEIYARGGHTHVAAICAAAESAVIYITTGDGV